MIPSDPQNWYWRVDGRVYSSAANAYVETDDEAYLAWQAKGGVATVIPSEAELDDVLARHGKSLGKADTPAAAIDRILAGRGTRDDMRDVLIGFVRAVADFTGKTPAQVRSAIIQHMPSR